MLDYNLTLRHEEIRTFIKNNPGCTKQDVIEYMGSDKALNQSSYVTVRNYLDDLVEWDIIKIQNNPRHRQEKILYLNNNDAYNIIIEEIVDFEKVFLRFWDALLSYKHPDFRKSIPLQSDVFLLTYLGSELFGIFSRLVQYKMMETWAVKNWSIEERKKVFSIVFSRLADMHIRLQKYPLGDGQIRIHELRGIHTSYAHMQDLTKTIKLLKSDSSGVASNLDDVFNKLDDTIPNEEGTRYTVVKQGHKLKFPILDKPESTKSNLKRLHRWVASKNSPSSTGSNSASP